MKRYFFLIAGICVLIPPLLLFGQELDSVGIAEIYPINELGAVSGDIISLGLVDTVYKLADTENDSAVVGVVAIEPLLLFETGEPGLPLVRTGQTRVRVSTINGTIFTGDHITSSLIPGRGQKARIGATNVIGIALEPFPAPNATATETILFNDTEVQTSDILVDLKIGPLEGGIGADVDLSALERFNSTRTAIQIIVAAGLALGSIYFAFRNFGSSIQNGILSVGRNPRAKITINTTVLLHLALILAISGAGIFLAFIILSVPLF